MQLKKYKHNPILSPNKLNAWESLVVCNPGAWYENGKFYLLYRAAGNDVEHMIRFGLAISDDGFNFERVSNKPVFEPSLDGHDSGAVEDPRIVKFGKDFYVTYASRPYPPGQYWKNAHDVISTPNTYEEAPSFLKENIANTSLAVTKDFKNWKRLGRITPANLDDRDVILFPERINGKHQGKYALLRRPKQWVGKNYNTEYPAIWITFSDDLLVWDQSSQLLIKGREGSWEEKVGGNTPPIKTDAGWLLLYHGVENGGKGYYRVGAALLDKNDPTKVLARTPEPIMEPKEWYEMEGPYPGCVFPVGNVVVGEELYVYYGAADKYCGIATCNLEDLITHILQFKT